MDHPRYPAAVNDVPGSRSRSQLAAAAGAEEVPAEPLSELDFAPDPGELDVELSDLAGSLAVEALLRLSVR
jgi:hypothetical protein